MAQRYIPADRRIVPSETAGKWKEQVEDAGGVWHDVDGTVYTSAFSDGDTVLLPVDSSNGLTEEILLVYDAETLLFTSASGIESIGGTDSSGTHWVVVSCDESDDVEEVRRTEETDSSGVTPASVIDRFKVYSVQIEARDITVLKATSLVAADIPAQYLPYGVRNGEIKSSRKTAERLNEAGDFCARFAIEARFYRGRETVKAQVRPTSPPNT